VGADSEACSKVTVPLTVESPRRTATGKCHVSYCLEDVSSAYSSEAHLRGTPLCLGSYAQANRLMNGAQISRSHVNCLSRRPSSAGLCIYSGNDAQKLAQLTADLVGGPVGRWVLRNIAVLPGMMLTSFDHDAS